MSRICWFARWGLAIGVGALLAALFPAPLHLPAANSAPPTDELPTALSYVPTDAALVLCVDVARAWDSPVLKAIRTADRQFVNELTTLGKTDFGFTPDAIGTVVVFVPKIIEPEDITRLGIVVSFKQAYDSVKLARGAEKHLPADQKVKVVPVSEQIALVLLNLGDEYAKPQPAHRTGPLSPILKQAARGQHLAVAGVTLANWPDVLRSDEVPPAFRPFQPLAHAQILTATVDLNQRLDLTVRVKAATAGQATDCEKSLGVLVRLLQDELKERIATWEKDAALRDLVAVLTACQTATQSVKFSTLGTETHLNASLPLELPFGTAFTTARQKLQDAAIVAQSANNLKQIALALHNYHDTYGAFPPAAVCDKTATPQLSWRVLILPFIEQEELFKQFKLDEPWDSEHNKKLLPKMPKVFAIPGQRQASDTYYRVFVGNGAGFDWIMGTQLNNITDGTSNTLMVVTAAEAVPWTKPDELNFDPEKDMTKLMGLVVNGKAQTAFFDGSVRTLTKLPPKKNLNALITKNGGEVIDDDER